jgi:hypothetical protein
VVSASGARDATPVRKGTTAPARAFLEKVRAHIHRGVAVVFVQHSSLRRRSYPLAPPSRSLKPPLPPHTYRQQAQRVALSAVAATALAAAVSAAAPGELLPRAYAIPQTSE